MNPIPPITLTALALVATAPVFAEPAYTAVLHQRINIWQLVPAEGPDIQITMRRSACRSGPALPRGDWNVERDANGGLILRPVAVELPSGFPERVPVLPCGSEPGARPALYAPGTLIDWLGGVAATVRVRD